jgi:diguanylate cyclase
MYDIKIIGGCIMKLNQVKSILSELPAGEDFTLMTKGVAEMQKNRNDVFCLCFIGIDNLSDVNDKYGYAAGDEILSQVAGILKDKFANIGITGYYGGDEFAVIISSTAPESVLIILEETRKLISNFDFRITAGDGTENVKITVSIGYATFPADAGSVEELFRQASHALYRAKKSGKNRVCMSKEEKMVPKSNYYTKSQLEQLAEVAKFTKKSEAFLLREALDILLQNYWYHMKWPDCKMSLTLTLGVALIDLCNPSKGAEILKALTAIRSRLKEEDGILIPPVRMVDNSKIRPNSYIVHIAEKEFAKGEVFPERVFAAGTYEQLRNLDGIKPVTSTDMWDGAWILPGQKEEAEKAGCRILDPSTYIVEHLAETFKMMYYFKNLPSS